MNENLPRSGDVSSGGTASNVKEKVRETASTLAHDAKEQAREQFDSRKGTAIGELDGLASALRRAGSELDNSSGMSGKVLSTVADRIESFSRSLDGRDLDGIVHDVEGFARRNPAAFLGGAIAIGFLASRFLKSSSTRSRDFYGRDLHASHESRSDTAVGTDGYPVRNDFATDFTAGTNPATAGGIYGASPSTGIGTSSTSGTRPRTTTPDNGSSDIQGSIGTTSGSDLGTTGDKRQR